MTTEQRLERLERRANRYRNALVLLVMSVCSVALIGAKTDDGVITAKAPFLTNDEGMPVIVAGPVEDGNGFTGAGAVGLFRLHAGGQTHRKPTQLAMSQWSGRSTWNGASALSDQIVLV